MPLDHDARSIGAAITTELCGHWEHAGPCPVAPHHTSWSRDGETVLVRVLFAADHGAEPAVRAGIERGLSAEQFYGPDGSTVRWRVQSSQAARPQQEEQARLARLISDS